MFPYPRAQVLPFLKALNRKPTARYSYSCPHYRCERILCSGWMLLKNIQLFFSTNHQAGSSIHPEGDSLIQCVALDDVVFDFAPTFITMDIEGAEIFALRGMRKIIERYHPKLAISVYHNPEHLWKIPLLLQEIAPDYKFYLRNYTSFSFETILYAI